MEIYYCCPPVELAAHMLRKLEQAPGVTALIVLPYWESAVFWPLLRTAAGFHTAVRSHMMLEAVCQDYGAGASIMTRKSTQTVWAAVYKAGTDSKVDRQGLG